MALRPTLKALKGSAAPKHTEEWGPVGEDAEDRGYIAMEYEDVRPVVSNEQFKGYRESIGTLGNDGTSSPAFRHQPQEVSAVDGYDGGLVEETKPEVQEEIGAGDEASKAHIRGRESQGKEEAEED